MNDTDKKIKPDIYTALCKFQGEIKNPAFDRENPHFRSKYASLPTILELVLPILTKNGIALIQSSEMSENKVNVRTSLYHAESNTEVYTHCELPVQKQDAQGYGSAITYARRYGIMSICAIAGDDDDDGNEAVSMPKKQGKPAITQPTKVVKPPEVSTVTVQDTAENSTRIVTGIERITVKDGVGTGGKPYKLYTLYVEDGNFTTFSDTHAVIAKSAKDAGLKVAIDYTKDKYGRKITSLDITDDETSTCQNVEGDNIDE